MLSRDLTKMTVLELHQTLPWKLPSANTLKSFRTDVINHLATLLEAVGKSHQDLLNQSVSGLMTCP